MLYRDRYKFFRYESTRGGGPRIRAGQHRLQRKRKQRNGGSVGEVVIGFPSDGHDDER